MPGPIGLELAVAFKQTGIDYVHLEAGQIAQTISWFPKMTRFFSSPDRIAIASVPLHTADQANVTREEYLTYLQSIVTQFDLDIRTYERVTQIDKTNEGFVLTVNSHSAALRYEVKHIVLAVGGLAKPRLLHIPGEDLEHVNHYFDEPQRYIRKKLLIVGGKNSAVEAAICCHGVDADVVISYRQPAFDPNRVKPWLLPEINSLIDAGEITFYPNTVPRAITSFHTTLAPVPGTAGEKIDVDSDFVLLLTGYLMDTTLFKMLGVDLVGKNQAPRLNLHTMETNVPGVFVAGTSVAGTQESFKLFIENCHDHIPRIVAALAGQLPPPIAEPSDENIDMLEN